MKNVILSILLFGAIVTSHKEVEKEERHTYKSIFDYDPDKQDFIQLCCERKPNPKSPMEYLPPPTAF